MRYCFSMANSSPLYSEDVIMSSFTDEHGVVHQVGCKQFVNISDPEFAKNHFPDPEQYTLQNQIDAGINLQEVPSPFAGGAPSDVEAAQDAALEYLENDDNFKKEDN